VKRTTRWYSGTILKMMAIGYLRSLP
jgi:hypothetical protein